MASRVQYCIETRSNNPRHARLVRNNGWMTVGYGRGCFSTKAVAALVKEKSWSSLDWDFRIVRRERRRR